MVPAMVVPADGCSQHGKLGIIKVNVLIPDMACKKGSTRAVIRIFSVIAPADIVQEGKILDDAGIGAVASGEYQTIRANPCPVRDAMDAVPVKAKLSPEEVDQVGRDDFAWGR